MEYPFSYDTIAAKRNVIGREDEINLTIKTLANDNRNLVIYGGPRSGKETIIKEALRRMEENGQRFKLCTIDLFNIRCFDDFVKLMRSKMAECFHFVNKGALIPFDIDISGIPPQKLFELPEIIAQESGVVLLIYFKCFHNLLAVEDENFSIQSLDKAWSKHRKARYIISGSCINMMKTIVEERKLFFYSANQIQVNSIDRRKACEYISSGFTSLGRVIEMEEAMTICDVCSSNMWYIKHLCSICHSQPAGYVNHRIVNQCTDSLLSIHEPRFHQIMLDLTTNQINFIKAVLDGVEKFSSAEIIESYHLNSSANVFRIKDALKKKEVLSFDKDDHAQFIDPLFEYWLKHIYFTL